MEVVASPLTFNHSMSLTKRRRACSPMVDIGTDSGTSDDFIMTDDSQYHHCKKRRIGSMDEGFTAPLPMSSFSSPFQSSPMNHTAKQFSGSASPKRSQVGETPSCDQSHSLDYMREVMGRQAEELETLKSDKSSLEAHNVELRSLNDKVMNENKILKKAVNIQQERQHHAALELDAARKYKDDAENRIRRLEQIIVSLRFHLQAQHCPENDFMNFNSRPPDVF